MVNKNKKISVSGAGEIVEGDIMILNYEMFNKTTNKNSDKFKDPKKGQYNISLFLLDYIKSLKNIDLLVLDEAHVIKNLQSATTKNILKIRKYCDRIVAMTGTPILNRPEEMWSIFTLLDYKHLFGGTKDNFLKTYCGGVYNFRFNRMEADFSRVPDHIKNEFQLKLRTNFMIRRLKKDVLKDLPEKIRSIIPLSVDTSFLRDFKGIESITTNLTNLASNVNESNASTNILSGLKLTDVTEIAKIRYATGVSKVRECIDYINTYLEEDEPVIIFGHHKDVLERYKYNFPHASMITGDTPEPQRIKEVEKFQSGKTNVFIGNFVAAGVGITLTRSSHVFFVEMDFVPANMIQAEDRANRIGQKFPVTVHYLVAENTPDIFIAETIIRKMKIIDRLLNIEQLK